MVSIPSTTQRVRFSRARGGGRRAATATMRDRDISDGYICQATAGRTAQRVNDRGRGVRSRSVVLPRHRHGEAPRLLLARGDVPRAAADRAVLDVELLLTAAGVDEEGDQLPAVGALDLDVHATRRYSRSVAK